MAFNFDKIPAQPVSAAGDPELVSSAPMDFLGAHQWDNQATSTHEGA